MTLSSCPRLPVAPTCLKFLRGKFFLFWPMRSVAACSNEQFWGHFQFTNNLSDARGRQTFNSQNEEQQDEKDEKDEGREGKRED